MTADDMANLAAPDERSPDRGYEPELKRTLSAFQVFAVSFAFISVAVGIFATYDDLLKSSDRSASGCGSLPPSGKRW